MTEQVCQVYASSSKDNCNECLMSDCNDCLDACFDGNNCPGNFSFNRELKLNSPSTEKVSMADTPNYPAGSQGERYVCNINPTGTPLEVKVGSGNFQNILAAGYKDNEFGFNVTGIEQASPNSSGLYVTATHSNSGGPTLPSGKDVFVKGMFTGKTAGKSFEYIQDIYRENFKKYIEFHKEHPELPPIDIDLYSLRTLDEDSLSSHLFNLVKNMYNISTFDSKTIQYDKKNITQDMANLIRRIDEKRAVLQDLKELNSTNKRNIEINMNKSRKLRDTNQVLMYVMIVIGFMILFPIITAAKLMSKQSGIMVWCFFLIFVLAYMVYELYFKQLNRDETEYRKYVFAKPTDKEIARSRAMAQLSDKDKARCQAYSELEEELDAPRINMDVSEYYSKTNQVDQCANIE
jgi:hypothetical protein